MAIGDKYRAAKAELESREQTETAPATPAQATGGLSPEMLQAIAAISGMQTAQLADVLKQVVQSQAQATADVVKSAKSRMPESYRGDFPYPGISVFSPTGEPLPALKCPMFLGVWDHVANKHEPVFPIIADDTGGATMDERRLLNALEQGAFEVERRDEVRGTVRVVMDRDADGTPTRLTIAVPKNWLEKGEHRALPSLKALARQLQPTVAA